MKPMDCGSAAKEIAAYAQGQLQGEALAALEAHLSACLRCQDRLHLLGGALSAAASLKPEPDRFTEAVLARVAQAERVASVAPGLLDFRLPRTPLRLAVAFSLASLVLVAGLFAVRRPWKRPAGDAGTAPLAEGGCVVSRCGSL